jgi:hypothetical protein
MRILRFGPFMTRRQSMAARKHWLLALVAFAIGTFFIGRKLHGSSSDRPSVAAIGGSPRPAADAPLPPAQDSDASLRTALRDVSPRDLFQSWLSQDDLLERLAAVDNALARDESVSGELEFLRPHRAFAPGARGFKRFDAFANVVSSLDERKVALAYRALHPLLESAVHAIAPRSQPLDQITQRALQRIVDAPVRDEVKLSQSGAYWFYDDPQLERAGPVEKQLLRMGARNTRLLQNEAREIASALGMQLRGEAQASGLR